MTAEHPAPKRADALDQVAATARAVEATWRIEAAKIIATLTRYTGDFGLAEELAQDALAEALSQWPSSGVPANPAAWLTAVAKRRAIDAWRRSERLDRKTALIAGELRADEEAASVRDALPWDPDEIDDDVLRLVFISCHPVLSREAQVALTLRVIGGLTTEQIARAFLQPVATIQQRIVRAKKRLADAEVPFALPSAAERGGRLQGVLSVLYLMFSEGHVATSGTDWMRPELAMEALRLTRITAALMPDEPDIHGLVALMALTAARFPARVDERGNPVLLADQNRTRWDRALIRLGARSLAREAAVRVSRAVRSGTAAPGRGVYALQAAIAASHAAASSVPSTDWARIVELYDELCRVAPSPITELNRAIAVAEAEGPDAGLRLVDEIAATGAIRESHLIPSVRGELLKRMGQFSEARAELERAAARATNDRERAVLRDKAARIV